MQEGIARAVTQLDETETLLRIEPLHNRVHLGTADRTGHRRLTAEGTAFRARLVIVRLRLTKIIVEPFTARLAEISTSTHVFSRFGAASKRGHVH